MTFVYDAVAPVFVAPAVSVTPSVAGAITGAVSVTCTCEPVSNVPVSLPDRTSTSTSTFCASYQRLLKSVCTGVGKENSGAMLLTGTSAMVGATYPVAGLSVRLCTPSGSLSNVKSLASVGDSGGATGGAFWPTGSCVFGNVGSWASV